MRYLLTIFCLTLLHTVFAQGGIAEAKFHEGSGYFINGDSKGLATLVSGSGAELFIATQNRDSVKVFRRNSDSSKSANVVRAGSSDEYGIVELKNGSKRKTEFYYGSGYLSSGSRAVVTDSVAVQVTLFPEKKVLAGNK